MKARPNQEPNERGGAAVRVLLVLGVFLAAGALLWVVLLPGIAASMIRRQTDFGVKVDGLAVNPFTANVTIKGLVIKNPAGWPADEFVRLREFRASGNLFSLFGRRMIFHEITIDLAQMNLVRNREGTLNAVAFQEALAGKEKAGSKEGAQKEFLIKHLVLKFDKLVYADYSGRAPVTKTYNLNLNRDMRDVDSVKQIISPIAGSALGLVSESLGGALKVNPDLLKELTGAVQDVGKKTGEKLKGLLDSLDKQKP